jgi:hypothetical protein
MSFRGVVIAGALGGVARGLVVAKEKLQAPLPTAFSAGVRELEPADREKRRFKPLPQP